MNGREHQRPAETGHAKMACKKKLIGKLQKRRRDEIRIPRRAPVQPFKLLANEPRGGFVLLFPCEREDVKLEERKPRPSHSDEGKVTRLA